MNKLDQILAPATVSVTDDGAEVIVTASGADPSATALSIAKNVDAIIELTGTLRASGAVENADGISATLSRIPLVESITAMETRTTTVGGVGGWTSTVVGLDGRAVTTVSALPATTAGEVNPLAVTTPIRPVAENSSGILATYTPALARLRDPSVFASVMHAAKLDRTTSTPLATAKTGDPSKHVVRVLPTLQRVSLTPRGLALTFAALPMGVSVLDFDKAVQVLAAAVGCSPDSAVIEGLPDGRVVFCTGDLDPLDEVQTPGTLAAIHPGGDQQDFLYVGAAEDNKPVQLPLATTPSLLVTGLSGTGKTASVISAVAQLAAAQPVHLIAATGKDASDFGALDALAAGGVISGSGMRAREQLAEKIETVLADLARRSKHITARYGTSNFWELDQQQRPPLVVVLLDEFHRYLSGTSSTAEGKLAAKLKGLLMELVTAGRSAGAITILVTQRPSAKTIDADLRENITAAIALRQSESTARMSLGEGELWGEDESLNPARLPAGKVGRAVVAGSAAGEVVRARLLHISAAQLAEELAGFSSAPILGTEQPGIKSVAA